jgi:DNA ligase-1
MSFKTTLYKQTASNDIHMWTITVHNNVIITQYGKMYGKMQSSLKAIKGKNIGKSNETSPSSQATIEAKAMVQKKLDNNYFYTIEGAINNIEFRPMLATTFKSDISYPAYVQPKLDGVRCIAYKDETGSIILKSRNGKRYDIPHIEFALQSVIDTTTVILDGEIFAPGLSFQQVTSLVKRNREESEQLQYWVYDLFYPDNQHMPFNDRFYYLSLYEYNSTVVETRTIIVNNEEDVSYWHRQFVKEGFEGAIIRTVNGVYKPGSRSKDLMKLKKFDDDEFMIVDVEEVMQQSVSVPLFVCLTKHGKQFRVFQSGTLQEKVRLLGRKNQLIGEMLKVKHFGYTEKGIPRFPIGMGIRMREDM